MKKNKYYPLYEFLKNSKKIEIKLSYKEITDILGFNLPKSSKIGSWWANSPEDGHTQAHAWVDAGFDAFSRQEYVIFRKK